MVSQPGDYATFNSNHFPDSTLDPIPKVLLLDSSAVRTLFDADPVERLMPCQVVVLDTTCLSLNSGRIREFSPGQRQRSFQLSLSGAIQNLTPLVLNTAGLDRAYLVTRLSRVQGCSAG